MYDLMAAYRAMIATVAAPTVFLAELPVESLSFTDVLNGASSCTISVPLESYLSDTATVAAGSTVLWVERDGVLGALLILGDHGQVADADDLTACAIDADHTLLVRAVVGEITSVRKAVPGTA